MIYRIFTGCYIVAALVLVAACNDGLDIQTKYPFTVETMPVPKELKVNETAEIRCELKREGRWEDARYTIRWFLFDGEGTLKLDDGTVLQLSDRKFRQVLTCGLESCGYMTGKRIVKYTNNPGQAS